MLVSWIPRFPERSEGSAIVCLKSSICMIKARFSIRIFFFRSGGQVLSVEIVRRVRKSVSAQLQAERWVRRVLSTAASAVVELLEWHAGAEPISDARSRRAV